MSEFIQAIKTARTMYPRTILALAATLYSIFTAIGPDLAHYAYAGRLPHSLVLPANYKWVAAALFALDAFGLWWRIFDAKPRVVWATLFNFLTAGLWLTVTVASITLYDELWSENVGEIILTLTAWYTLTRTDYTPSDRGSA
jgi:hypothetical protein